MKHSPLTTRTLLALYCALAVAISHAQGTTMDANVQQLNYHNHDFALRLLQQLDHPDNLVFSPYSINQALNMTYAGARGQTASEMARVLGIANLEQDIHASNGVLYDFLRTGSPPLRSGLADQTASQNQEGDPIPPNNPALEGQAPVTSRAGQVSPIQTQADDTGLRPRGPREAPEDASKHYQFSVANALWAQIDYPFLIEYANFIQRNYGAAVANLDFRNNSEVARLHINRYVAEKTQNTIQDLLSPRDITRDTQLVITNAIYFKAAWSHTFPERQTHQAPFYLLDGRSTGVEMMRQTSTLPYSRTADFQLVELGYETTTNRFLSSPNISMYLLLPDSGKFAEVLGRLQVDELYRAFDALEAERLELSLPKFHFDSPMQLSQALAAMGMPTAFSPFHPLGECASSATGNGSGADFSGMDGTRCLVISDVIHQAFIDVNEHGSEAAAATAVIMMTRTSLPLAPRNVTFDRPFIFMIRDKVSGSLLFLGQVTHPE